MSDYNISGVSFEHWLCACNERKRTEPNRTEPNRNLPFCPYLPIKKKKLFCPFHSTYSTSSFLSPKSTLSASTLQSFRVKIERKRRTYCREAVLRVRDDSLTFPLNCASRRQLRGYDLSKRIDSVRRTRNFVPLKKRESEEKLRIFSPIKKNEVIPKKINRKYASLCSFYKSTVVPRPIDKTYINNIPKKKHLEKFKLTAEMEREKRRKKEELRFSREQTLWKRTAKSKIIEWCLENNYPCSFADGVFRMKFRRAQLKTLNSRRRNSSDKYWKKLYHNFRRKTRGDDTRKVSAVARGKSREIRKKKHKLKKKSGVPTQAEQTFDKEVKSLEKFTRQMISEFKNRPYSNPNSRTSKLNQEEALSRLKHLTKIAQTAKIAPRTKDEKRKEYMNTVSEKIMKTHFKNVSRVQVDDLLSEAIDEVFTKEEREVLLSEQGSSVLPKRYGASDEDWKKTVAYWKKQQSQPSYTAAEKRAMAHPDTTDYFYEEFKDVGAKRSVPRSIPEKKREPLVLEKRVTLRDKRIAAEKRHEQNDYWKAEFGDLPVQTPARAPYVGNFNKPVTHRKWKYLQLGLDDAEYDYYLNLGYDFDFPTRKFVLERDARDGPYVGRSNVYTQSFDIRTLRPYTLDKTLFIIGGGSASLYDAMSSLGQVYDVVTDSFVVPKPPKKKSWLSLF